MALTTACSTGFQRAQSLSGMQKVSDVAERVATPTPAPSVGVEKVYTTAQITFYGYDDNDDGKGHFGSSAIALPSLHKIATEDFGTYDHPSTFATDTRIASKGTKIYIPRLHKYYIMEDKCGACTTAADAGSMRIDLYMGDNDALQGNSLDQCEMILTQVGSIDTVIVNPASTYPVSTTPLYSSGKCNQITF